MMAVPLSDGLTRVKTPTLIGAFDFIERQMPLDPECLPSSIVIRPVASERGFYFETTMYSKEKVLHHEVAFRRARYGDLVLGEGEPRRFTEERSDGPLPVVVRSWLA